MKYSNSIANPAIDSAFFGHGVKPAGNFVTFSIGTRYTNADDYVTKTSAGEMPGATITDGILTFTVPQSHKYVGVGDEVVIRSTTVYLNKKIDCRMWEVKTATGGMPADLSGTLVSINKAFSLLRDAIHGDTPGAAVLLETSDLVSRSIILRLMCYEFSDTGISTLEIKNTIWTTGPFAWILIKSASDIKTECNYSQIHNGTFDTGYRISTILSTNSMKYIQFDGLSINGYFSPSSYGFDKFVIKKCIINSTSNTISCSTDSTDFEVSWNIINTSSGTAISTNGNGRIFNNTVIGGTKGIEVGSGANGYVKNCLIQDSTTCISKTGSPVIEYIITSDDTASTFAYSFGLLSVVFRDKSELDFRLLPNTSSISSSIIQGLYFLNEINSLDILGNKLDDSFSIGAEHWIVTINVSVGDAGGDIKEGGVSTFTISDNIITFSHPQTNYRLCAGCQVYGGGNQYSLVEKIDNSNWYATYYHGYKPDDIGATTLSSIKFSSNNLYSLLEDNGVHWDLYHYYQYKDFLIYDLRVKISCVDPSAAYKGVSTDGYTCDDTHRIIIYTPTLPTECNQSLRHNGLLNTNKFYQIGDLENTSSIEIGCDGVTIDGLQITSDYGYGVYVKYGKNIVLTNNIIYNCLSDGIRFDNNVSDAVENLNVVVNNLIYKSSEYGINILHNFGKKSKGISSECVAGNNDWSIESNKIGSEPNDYFVNVVAGDTSEVRWTKKSVTIVTPGMNTGDVFSSAIITGSVWGTLTAISNISNIELMPATKLIDMDYPVYGNYGDNNAIFAIYNNTVYGCKNGIRVESKPFMPYTNIIYLKNNLVQNSEEKDFINIFHKSSTVHSESNWCLDSSLDKFNGFNNETEALVEFRNKSIDDYHLALCDSISMVNAINLYTDGIYSFENDYGGDDRSDYKWDVGCDSWSPIPSMVNFSMGSDTANLDETPNGRNIIINNGILEFTGGTIGGKIGVGDKVVYDGGICYLAEKGTDYKWYVTTNVGGAVVDTDELSCTSIKRVANTLGSMISEYVGCLAAVELGNTLNLDSLGMNLNIWCYNDGADDAGGVLIKNWVNTNYRIRVATPWNTNTQCIVSQRHAGVWGNGFKIVRIIAGVGIRTQNNNVTIEGLQVQHTLTSQHPIQKDNSQTGVVIQYNIVKGGNTGIYAISMKSWQRAYIRFNIVYGQSVTGIFSQGYVYNNTVLNTITGFNGGYLYNNIAQNCSSNCYKNYSKIYDCVSDDSSAGTSDGCRSLVTFIFKNKVIYDYHLIRTDWWGVNQGSEVPIGYKFGEFSALDIDNEFMNDGWPVGADYIAVEPLNLIFSVGKNSSDLKSGVSPTISILGSVATFSENQSNDNVGIGDEVIYDTSKKCYLYEKKSYKRWVVKSKWGQDVDNSDSVVLNSIKHIYNELSVATGSSGICLFLGDSNNLFYSLSKVKIKLTISVYKHTTAMSNASTISSFLTNENSFIKIYTPYNRNECNSVQRHKGIDESLSAKITCSSSSQNIFDVQVDYTEIEGIIIDGNDDNNNGICFNNSNYCKADGNIIKKAVKAIILNMSM